ncbi:MAG: DUF5681 domain-containing protein [Acidocella sp.]|nr:DUF5681 domain-containing protein [Acidocella sp.]
MNPETTGRQQAGRFTPGISGNPQGRPPGARHRVTVLAEKLMADDAENVVKSVIKAANNGDMVAARLVLDRIAPPRKGSFVTLSLPKITDASDVLDALAAITAAASSGEITMEEAACLAGLVEGQRRAIETSDLEARIIALESRLSGDGGDDDDIPLINGNGF